MFKRLAEPTGAIEGEKSASDTNEKIVRPAIVVHAGPENSAIEFQSGDGPIKFDADRIKRVVDVHNKRLEQLAAEYGGEDKIPMGAYEPILDQHGDDSNDRTIGRLTGRLKFEVRNVPKVGNNVPCAVAEGITFLGKETVERVNDGRIYHLSIGIDEKDDSLGETSTVIKPAAPGAMLLKQGKGGEQIIKTGGKTQMGDKLKRLKAHQARMTKLSAIKTSVEGSQTNLKGTSELIRLTAKKADITHRLRALCSEGKMTPAEFKSLVSADDLTHLAKLDDKTLSIAMKPYESREKAVINPSQNGTTDAVDFAKLSEGDTMKRLKAETKSELKRLGAKMKMSESEEKDAKDAKLAGVPGAAPAKIEGDKGAVGAGGDEKQMAEAHDKLAKALESGDVKGAKDAHEELKKHMTGMKHMAEYTGDTKSEDFKKSADDQQKQIDELNTQLARIHGMVSELIEGEKEEGHDLESGIDPEDKQPAAAAS